MITIAILSALVVFVTLVLGLLLSRGEAVGTVARRNFRLWHIAIFFVAVLLFPWGMASAASSAGSANVVGGYKQFINGVLVSADQQFFTCTENGPCEHEYECNVYYTSDDKGNQTKHSDDCPYVKGEYSYYVTAWVGYKWVTYTIADHIFSSHPVAWSNDEGIPSDVARGTPSEWIKYKKNIASGHPNRVTFVDDYNNYILASQDTILKQYSGEVDPLLSRHLLPEHTAGFLEGNPIHDRWVADKMAFVGFKPPDRRAWEIAVMDFNGAFGIEKQGDLHIVAINDAKVGRGQSESYTNALKAYWQGPLMKKKAIAKNSVIVALGVNPATDTVTWARAQTGMPGGNGGMVAAINDRLTGQKFDPQNIIGSIGAHVVSKPKGKEVVFRHGTGLLDRIVFTDFPFKRACVECKDKNEKSSQSFVYLKADIKLPLWSYLLAVFLSVIGAIAGAILVAVTSPDFTAAPTRPSYGYR